MKLYKVIGSNNRSMSGGYFDWSEYLPKDGIPGKWTPEVEVDMCHSGYHVTEYWNMWHEKDARIFEVDVRGHFKHTDIGVCTKHAYQSIRLVREYKPDFTGNFNTGDFNTGYRNTGDFNTGYFNTGNCNTGYRNTGDGNTGNCNTGDYNTGNCNTGYRNTGDFNTGNFNTGYFNTGDFNTGNRNTGYRNTGNFNTGNCNTGNWNIIDHSTGFFNTIEHDEIIVFNRPTKLTVWQSAQKPSFIFFDLLPGKTYKESFAASYENATEEDIKLLKALPNFDADVFYEISGITIDVEEKKND